jgi:hypothetical protein
MAKMDLTAENIGELGEGLVGRAIDREIAKVVADIDDRPKSSKSRVVTIKLSFTPSDAGIEVEGEVTSKIPAYRPPVTNCIADRDGGLFFSPDAAGNAEQDALPGAGRHS